ncbi:MAG TPA: efflux RND transporter periplasmic adaptor subunit [Kiritimatiellia bacterium]|nr:efflux RND transporter periplasmic adaptor subunit [Kiritimatiellia bacterium]
MNVRGWCCAAWVCAAGLLWGCGRGAVEPPPPSARPVKLAVAETRAPGRTFTASGRIKAAQRAELSFDRADVLAELPVIQGQPVQAGDVLARLDTRNLELAEKARLAAFDEARTNRDRLQRLFERQAVARADLDRAQASFENAEASLLQVRKDLETSVLRAPFTGRVAATMADRFQLVQARQPIVVVQDLSRYEVEIQVPETFILQVGQSTGSQVTARFDQLPGLVLPVKLKDFTTEASPETLTYNAVFTMQAPEGSVLLPGMSVSIGIELQQAGPAGACWVPERALFSDDAQRTLVWRVDPATSRVAAQPVAIGQRRGGYAQVTDGLAAGDRVAVSGLHTLRDGDEVRAYEAPDRS